MSSAVWATVAGLALSTAAIKAAGPVLLGGRRLPLTTLRVITLLAPALLAALLVTETVSAEGGGGLTVDERALGLGAAAVALVLRAPLVVVVLVAAAAAAVARALA